MLDTLETHACRAAGRCRPAPAIGRCTLSERPAQRARRRHRSAQRCHRRRRDGHRGRRRHGLRGHRRPVGGRPRRRLRTRSRAGARRRRPTRDRLRGHRQAHGLGSLCQRCDAHRRVSGVARKAGLAAGGLCRRRQPFGQRPRPAHRRAPRHAVERAGRAGHRDEPRRANSPAVGVHDAVGAGHRACGRRDAGALQRRPVQRLLPADTASGGGQLRDAQPPEVQACPAKNLRVGITLGSRDDGGPPAGAWQADSRPAIGMDDSHAAVASALPAAKSPKIQICMLCAL